MYISIITKSKIGEQKRQNTTTPKKFTGPKINFMNKLLAGLAFYMHTNTIHIVCELEGNVFCEMEST